MYDAEEVWATDPREWAVRVTILETEDATYRVYWDENGNGWRELLYC